MILPLHRDGTKPSRRPRHIELPWGLKIAQEGFRRGVNFMWGKHLIIDMSAGEPDFVRSGEHIRRFAARLVEALDMKAYGPACAAAFRRARARGCGIFARTAHRDIGHHRAFLRQVRRCLHRCLLLQGFRHCRGARRGPQVIPAHTREDAGPVATGLAALPRPTPRSVVRMPWMTSLN